MTVGTWHEAITTGRVFDQGRDTPRIRAGFATLFNTVERWPQPKHLLNALPRVEDAPRLRHEVKPASPAVVAKAREEVEKFLHSPNPQKPADPGALIEATRRADLEEQLRTHYAKSGKAAAAGPDA